MNFYDKVTGKDIKRSFDALNSRVAQLPQKYQQAWDQIQEHIWVYTNFSGRNLVPILDAILELLEESALENSRIENIVGKDIEKFIATIANVQGAKNQRDKWRNQLNNTVAKK
ncbi:MAG: DUF1048 domain-containing protein [Enterococcus lacertideformus]|uniref:DUF1048 domain-containing protein n=1 Tax=Enterococcus lacertideformus TaxID=2771493 RepID=A0A931FBP2_9ENTE|nr:DUF1048 domain-containing protein [Enterococcus lacertideformus]